MITYAWVVAIAVVLICVVLAIIAIRIRRAPLGLAALFPLVTGLLIAMFDVNLAAPEPLYRNLLALTLILLGVIGGYPVTIWVLGLATPKKRSTHKREDDGEHGGIVVEGHEVLRGGWVIGYLERIAVIVAVVLGRFEIIAALIAVKGLGRFSELDTSVARERFIIGTLTSLSWAAAFGLLIVAVRS